MTRNKKEQTDADHTHRVELLLKAALLKGEEAKDAWRNWRAHVDFEGELDWTSYRLLPLLYQNLKRLRVDDPLMGRIKGVYRRAWYRNQNLFRSGAAVIRALQAAGIETLILKGAALTWLYYKDYGLRPMEDFDVLVPTQKRRAAIDVLNRNGWTPRVFSFCPLEESTERRLDVLHAWPFNNGVQQELDLHWHVIPPLVVDTVGDEDFWACAIPVANDSVTALALNASDQLFHICAHGGGWSPMVSMQWVADALTILNTAQEEIDWEQLVERAKQHQLTLPLLTALQYLTRAFHAAVPADILERLSEVPVSDLDRKYYRVIAAPEPDLYAYYASLWYSYLRATGADRTASTARKLAGFLDYLCLTKGMTYRQLTYWAVTRSIVRISEHLRR